MYHNFYSCVVLLSCSTHWFIWTQVVHFIRTIIAITVSPCLALVSKIPDEIKINWVIPLLIILNHNILQLQEPMSSSSSSSSSSASRHFSALNSTSPSSPSCSLSESSPFSLPCASSTSSTSSPSSARDADYLYSGSALYLLPSTLSSASQSFPSFPPTRGATLDQPHPDTLCEITVVGNAFLYHQVSAAAASLI